MSSSEKISEISKVQLKHLDHQSKGNAAKKNDFPKISLARKHLKNQVKKKLKNRYVCDKCEARFPNWWERRTHWLASGHKDPEICKWCGKKTYTLQSHLCKMHWGNAAMCPNCGMLFMFQEDLEKHVLLHDKSEYRCSHCGRCRKNEQLLRIHVYSHFLYEKYGCNVCEKRFKKKKNLEKHLTYVHFICKYCGSTSDNAGDLKTHQKIHDDLKCVLCQKVFSQKNRLKYHYQLLHGHQDFYKCSICFKKFVKKSILLDHLKLKHKGKSNFSCSICAAPFLYWQHYQNHFESQHIRKNDNKFDCPFCEFSTSLKLKLKCHVEKSSGIGFFCKKCQLRLECKGLFDKHMETHEGDSSWLCDHCPREFASDNSLRKHMLDFHRSKALAQYPRVYTCLSEDCGRSYVTKSSLSRHLRKNHSISDNMSHSSKSASVTSQEEKTDNISDINKNQDKEIIDQEEESIESQLTLESTYKSKRRKETVECITEEDSNETAEMLISDCTEVNVFNCRVCDKLWFRDEPQFRRHMKTHGKLVWQDQCDSCDIVLETPEGAAGHYVEEHLKVKFVHGVTPAQL